MLKSRSNQNNCCACVRTRAKVKWVLFDINPHEVLRFVEILSVKVILCVTV